MRVMVVVGAALSLLTACSQQRIEQGLNAHVGQPAATLFAKLSYPDGRTVVDGRRAYVWGSDQPAGSFLTPSASGGMQTRQMSLASTTLAMAPVDHACMIRVVVDQNDRILSYETRGNEGGCAPYARRLSR